VSETIIPPKSDFSNQENEELDLKPYLFIFLRNWYWLVLGALIGGTIAYLNLRYATTIYQVNASMLINEQQQQGISTDIIAEDLGLEPKSDVTNELRILKSTDLIKQVVDSLKLNISYETEGRIATVKRFGHYQQVKLEILSPEEQTYNRKLTVRSKDESRFEIIGDSKSSDTLIFTYGRPFRLDGERYVITKVKEGYKPGSTTLITIQPPEVTARIFAERLRLRNNPKSNVIDLSI
jgi:uncharacterized protein involved in exopolysaccharide biosynthesis